MTPCYCHDMRTALENAVATATAVAEALEAGRPQTPSVKASMPNLIRHLESLGGESTAELRARLQRFA